MSFHIILPSNTRGEGNRPNSFTVHLPKKLQFNSEWVVGLAVFAYPRTWRNVGTNSPQEISVFYANDDPAWELVDNVLIPQSRLNSPQQLEKHLKDVFSRYIPDLLKPEGFYDSDKVEFLPDFVYKPEYQKFYVASNNKHTKKIEMTHQLALLMGFPLTFKPNTLAQYSPDIDGGINSLVVYAPGLIEPQMIGDTTAPILRVVTVRGKNNDVIEDNYLPTQYHKLLVKEITEITIEIRDSIGALIPFEYGECRLTLHFKKLPYF